MPAPRPLDGLLAVSVEQAVAAPLCSARLADAGARVIKVERPEGDFARGYDRLVSGESSFFVWLNRGKESLVLDLRQTEDRDLLLDMLSRADIFVQNLKNGALKRLGIEAAALHEANPRLVICNIAGFRPGGAMAGRKAYDLLIQAESGLASVTGAPEEPGRVGISICDISTGAAAYEAILEALLERSRTGRGTVIDISMFDVLAEVNAVPWLQWRHGGKQPPRIGLRHPSIQPYGVFTAGDGGQILLAVQNEREWGVFCREVLKQPELAEDERFIDNTARVANRPALEALIGEALSSRSLEELCAGLDAADIAYGRLSDMAGLDAHSEFTTAACPTPAGAVPVPLPAARFAGEPRHLGAVPALGEHSEAIRLEFSRSREAAG